MVVKYSASHLILACAYLASALLLPWWATVAFGVILLALYKSYATAIFGGLLIDFAFSGGTPSLVPFLYTALFVFLSLMVRFLDRAMLS
jgi:hypothetical protein